MKKLRIAILGRPNVGKSTLFNRLVGRKRALVHDKPGVTRDRIIGNAIWFHEGEEIAVTLTDTGGVGGALFSDEILEQVRTALDESDLAIFVLDGKSGLAELDREVYLKLQKNHVFDQVPVLGAVNKIDADVHEMRVHDFYELGLDPLVGVSAEHNRGIDELRNELLRLGASVLSAQKSEKRVEEKKESQYSPEEASRLVEGEAAFLFDPDVSPHWSEDSEDSESKHVPSKKGSRSFPHIAIVGRPNVGKSTLLNALAGKKRMITSDMAGTTVDSVDTAIRSGDKDYLLVDTAGIRRKNKTEKGVEVLSVVQAKKALERSLVAILVIDAEKGITDQDEKIGGLIEEAGCAVVLLVNKWDVHKGNHEFSREEAAERIRKQMRFLSYAPILFASALKNQGLEHLFELIDEILNQRDVKVATHEFTEWVRREVTIHNPKDAKFFMCHQSGRHPPTFVCHVNDPKKVHFSLKRHLVNAIRERWGFMGNPIRIVMVQRGRKQRAR